MFANYLSGLYVFIILGNYLIKKVTFKDCFCLGVFAAIGFLSKYLFIYLLITIDYYFFM